MLYQEPHTTPGWSASTRAHGMFGVHDGWKTIMVFLLSTAVILNTLHCCQTSAPNDTSGKLGSTPRIDVLTTPRMRALIWNYAFTRRHLNDGTGATVLSPLTPVVTLHRKTTVLQRTHMTTDRTKSTRAYDATSLHDDGVPIANRLLSLHAFL